MADQLSIRLQRPLAVLRECSHSATARGSLVQAPPEWARLEADHLRATSLSETICLSAGEKHGPAVNLALGARASPGHGAWGAARALGVRQTYLVVMGVGAQIADWASGLAAFSSAVAALDGVTVSI